MANQRRRGSRAATPEEPKTEPESTPAEPQSATPEEPTEPTPEPEVEIPDPATPAPANPAEELIARKRAQREAKEAEEQKKREDELVYFLKCPRHADHIAAFFTVEPKGKIEPHQWYSIDHAVNEVYVKPFIRCQECALEGEERNWLAHVRPIPREDGQFDFVVSADRKLVIGSMPRSELGARRRAILEGEEVVS